MPALFAVTTLSRRSCEGIRANRPHILLPAVIFNQYRAPKGIPINSDRGETALHGIAAFTAWMHHCSLKG